MNIDENQRDDLESFLDERSKWSVETFGPVDHDRLASILDHIRKELFEIERAPRDLEEWIDVLMLALDGAFRCAGASSSSILPALRAKLEKCKARRWPNWRTHPPGHAVEHVRLETPEMAAADRAQHVTASDLAAMRAQELADFSPSATAISEPIEVREMPTLMLTRTIGDYKIREEIVRECYGSSSSSSPMRAQQAALVDVESGPTWQQTAAERDTAREALQQIRDLLTVENEDQPPSWFLGQIRQLLDIGITAEHDAVTLDLSGGES